jgi:hypothetical protein
VCWRNVRRSTSTANLLPSRRAGKVQAMRDQLA